MKTNQPITSHQSPVTSHLTDDLQFLVNCCKTDRLDKDIESILSYVNAERLTPNALISLANQHGILPLVYKTLKNLHSSLLTPHSSLEDLLADLKSAYSQIAQRNILMSAELLRIMRLLESNNIQALAFKGPVLAQMAYGDITLRQYSDLDILVDEKEVIKAGSVLDEHGYEPSFSIKILKNSTCLSSTNDLGFYNQSNGLLIELHWRLFREKIGQHLRFLQISENKQTVKINGKAIPTLSAEMLLVYLCLHGSKHAWERIEWICDIDRLLYANKEMDWDKVLTIAQEMDTTIPLYLGLQLSHRLFDTPLPEKIIVLTETERIEDLVTKTYTMLNSTLSDHEGYGRYNAIHLYQMDLLDTKLKKLRHLYTTYLGISRNDCQSFPLPSGLRFLYIFIKPFRVVIKYIQYGR